MDAERIEEIRKRAEAATSGPWIKDDAGPYIGAPSFIEVAEAYEESDAEFIAHSREDIPALLAEVDRLRCAVDEAMGYLSIGESRPANRYLAEALGVDENYHGYFGDDDDE